MMKSTCGVPSNGKVTEPFETLGMQSLGTWKFGPRSNLPNCTFPAPTVSFHHLRPCSVSISLALSFFGVFTFLSSSTDEISLLRDLEPLLQQTYN